MLSTLSSDYADIIQLQPTSSEGIVKSLRILISDIRKSLPKGKEHFLKDRTEEQLIEHFAKGNLAFGAVKEDKLVSCALMSDLSDPHLREFNAMNYGEKNLKQGNWAVHTVGVHPDHTRRGLMKSTLNAVFAHASNHNYYNLIAKVADANGSSRAGFISAEFSQAAHGIDRAAGYPFTVFSREIAPALAPDRAMLLNVGHGASIPASAFAYSQ